MQCGTRAANSTNGRCATCRTRDRVAIYKEQGRCTRCGGERHSGTYCLNCLQHSRSKSSKRLLEGRCYNCGAKDPVTADAYPKCLDCWCKGRAADTLQNRDSYTIIKDKLKQQDYRCAYTGQKLTLGVNASIDHIIPTSQGGTHEADNIQMICTIVNIMKHSTSHEEFLKLCEQIYKYSIYNSQQNPLVRGWNHV